MQLYSFILTYSRYVRVVVRLVAEPVHQARFADVRVAQHEHLVRFAGVHVVAQPSRHTLIGGALVDVGVRVYTSSPSLSRSQTSRLQQLRCRAQRHIDIPIGGRWRAFDIVSSPPLVRTEGQVRLGEVDSQRITNPDDDTPSAAAIDAMTHPSDIDSVAATRRKYTIFFFFFF